MTHALVNPVVTNAGHMPVACNPLQRQEELLESGQMKDTQGGIVILPFVILAAKAAAPYVAGAVTAIAVGVVLAEIAPNNGCNSCTCNTRPPGRR
ncbi:MAG: hypothetical protein OXR72_01525 [Gemmatimonadota bacterium]|nr:hypothetical protein [Gemmatimonadota bacterium]